MSDKQRKFSVGPAEKLDFIKNQPRQSSYDEAVQAALGLTEGQAVVVPLDGAKPQSVGLSLRNKLNETGKGNWYSVRGVLKEGVCVAVAVVKLDAPREPVKKGPKAPQAPAKVKKGA